MEKVVCSERLTKFTCYFYRNINLELRSARCVNGGSISRHTTVLRDPPKHTPPSMPHHRQSNQLLQNTCTAPSSGRSCSSPYRRGAWKEIITINQQLSPSLPGEKSKYFNNNYHRQLDRSRKISTIKFTFTFDTFRDPDCIVISLFTSINPMVNSGPSLVWYTEI